MAVGPRWHSTYEMACNVAQAAFEGRDHDLLANNAGLTPPEVEALFDVLMTSTEPAWVDHITELLKAGKGPREILDVIQLIAAENMLRTHDSHGFSMPQHSYEYCNTLRWFYDRFDHPHKLKLLYIAAAFVNRAVHHQVNTPGNGEKQIAAPRGADALSQGQLLERLSDALLSLQADDSVALTRAYLESSFDRDALVELLAVAACKLGNDPHNQELGLCLIEDYQHSTATGRDLLLMASAKHTAGHRKYGDPLEAYQRFAGAINLTSN